MKYHSLLLISSTLLLLLSLHVYASTQSKQQQQQSYNTRSARRERHLDHWDSDTLAYYLGVDEATGKVSPNHAYPGHDAAVLFYAQWCQNCHALAPSWDAIATHLNAGTVSSSLIMAVFDCEANTRHEKLCSIAGVQHYPTLLFIGDGEYHDSDVVSRTILGKKRASGPAGPSPIPHTVKFQGQWQYADSILDWLRLMQGFSKWHRWTSQGFLRYLRNGLLGFLRPQRLVKKTITPSSLPIGVPTTSSTTSTSTPNQASTTQSTTLLESQLKQAKDEGKLMEKAATHASLLLDGILFPQNKTTSDAFEIMNTTNSWKEDSQDATSQVLRTCVLELSVDYCARLNSHVTSQYLDEMENFTEIPTMPEIEALLKERIASREAYCDIMEACLEENFVSTKCRPPTCPFEPTGCRYINACLDPTIQREYAIAMKLIGEDTKEWPPKKQETTTTTSSSATSQEQTKKKKKGSWGF